MKLRDVLNNAEPGLRKLVPILDSMITAINNLSTVVFTGENPHKANDTADAITVVDSGDLDMVADLEKVLAANYGTHLGSTTYHIAADSTNTLTATSVYAQVKVMADDLKTKYNLHRVMTASSVHAGAGDPNAVTAAVVSSKATAILLLNDIKTMFNLHIINVTTCHGSTGVVDAVTLADLTSTATWAQIAAMADQCLAKYIAHVAQGSTIHGAADTTHDPVSATPIGSVQTAVDTLLTEMKADFNAHLSLLTSHYIADKSMAVSVADATTLVTSIALANALKTAFNDHISRAGEAVGVATLDTEETV